MIILGLLSAYAPVHLCAHPYISFLKDFEITQAIGTKVIVNVALLVAFKCESQSAILDSCNGNPKVPVLYKGILYLPYVFRQTKKVREKSRECHNHKPQPSQTPRGRGNRQI